MKQMKLYSNVVTKADSYSQDFMVQTADKQTAFTLLHKQWFERMIFADNQLTFFINKPSQ